MWITETAPFVCDTFKPTPQATDLSPYRGSTNEWCCVFSYDKEDMMQKDTDVSG